MYRILTSCMSQHFKQTSESRARSQQADENTGSWVPPSMITCYIKRNLFTPTPHSDAPLSPRQRVIYWDFPLFPLPLTFTMKAHYFTPRSQSMTINTHKHHLHSRCVQRQQAASFWETDSKSEQMGTKDQYHQFSISQNLYCSLLHCTETLPEKLIHPFSYLYIEGAGGEWSLPQVTSGTGTPRQADSESLTEKLLLKMIFQPSNIMQSVLEICVEFCPDCQVFLILIFFCLWSKNVLCEVTVALAQIHEVFSLQKC